MRASSSSGCLVGGLMFVLRGLLIGLLALTTFAFLLETFLVNLNGRSVATALVAEAGSEFLTPNLVKQDIVKTAYQDIQKQATAQPNGSVYAPFVVVPLPAKEVAGKSVTDLLRLLYTRVAGAYYDQPAGGIFGFTPAQAQQSGANLSQHCAEVDHVLAHPRANLPADMSQFLATFGGQKSGSGKSGNSGKSGSGSSGPPTATQLQVLQVAQKLCAPLRGGNGLSLSGIFDLAHALSQATNTTGSSANHGPSIPDFGHNPLIGFFGLSSPLSSTFEDAATGRQHVLLGIAAVWALLLALLSHGWARLGCVAVGVFLGGLLSMVPMVAFGILTSHNMAQLQSHAALVDLVTNQYTAPALIVTIAGGLAILAAIGGGIARRVLPARAGRAAAGAGASPVPVAVPDRSLWRPLPSASADAPAEPMVPSVYSTLPMAPTDEPAGPPAPSDVAGFSTTLPGAPISPTPPPASEPPVGADQNQAGPPAESSS